MESPPWPEKPVFPPSSQAFVVPRLWRWGSRVRSQQRQRFVSQGGGGSRMFWCQGLCGKVNKGFAHEGNICVSNFGSCCSLRIVQCIDSCVITPKLTAIMNCYAVVIAIFGGGTLGVGRCVCFGVSTAAHSRCTEGRLLRRIRG